VYLPICTMSINGVLKATAKFRIRERTKELAEKWLLLCDKAKRKMVPHAGNQPQLCLMKSEPDLLSKWKDRRSPRTACELVGKDRLHHQGEFLKLPVQ
jgi:hypothetical protein